MTRPLPSIRHSRGMTLVELVIAVVVIAIAVTSVLGLLCGDLAAQRRRDDVDAGCIDRQRVSR